MSGDVMTSNSITTAIAALETAGLTTSGLWGQVGEVADLVGKVALFAFGFYIIRKVIKGAAKGKVRL